VQSGIVPFSAKSKVTGGDKNIAVHYSENENCLSTERANAAVPHRGFFIESLDATAGSHLQDGKLSDVEPPTLK
jgi:hypothetical protein